MAASPYFDHLYFDGAYFDVDTVSSGRSGAKAVARRFLPKPPIEPEPLDEAEELLAWIP